MFPTACPWRLRVTKGIKLFPYSSNSIFSELKAFALASQPVGISATLENAGYDSKEKLVRDPAFWFRHLLKRYRNGDNLFGESHLDVNISSQLP